MTPEDRVTVEAERTPDATVSKRFAVRCLQAVVAVSAMAVALQVGDGSAAARALSGVCFVVFPSVAGLACLRRAARHGEDAGWRWVGTACLFWAAGGAVWASSGMAGVHYRFPSAADIGFLGYALPAAVGLLKLRSRTPLARSWVWRLLLDAAAIGVGVLFVSWATVLGHLYDAPVTDRLERVVGLAHPFVDLVMVSLVLALGMRKPAACRLPWLILAAGFTTLAVCDSVLVPTVLSGRYQSGHLFDVSWAIAFVLVALAATAPERPGRGQVDGPITRTQELLPHLPVALAVAVGLSMPVSLSTTPFLFWNAMLLLALVAIRHAVVTSQRIQLANDLERRVEERRAQLDRERGFLAAVLESMEEGVVACDAEGALTLFNDATRRLHGLPGEPVPFERWAEHYSLRQPDGVTPLMTDQIPLLRALRGESVRNEEFVIAPHGGRHRLVRSNGRAIVGPGGQQLGAVLILHDITERRRAQLDLEHRAFHDDLTGLGNRARFDAGVTAMLVEAEAERKPLTVLLADLDDFKRVNDSLGHGAGDRLLVEVSRRLCSCVRDRDLGVRLGGDEFIFVLEHSSPADAVVVARQMLDVLTRPVTVEGAEVLVGASIGIVSSTYGRDAKRLLGMADLAMYEAKHKGKGSYVVFDPAMQVLADSRLTLESEMRAALRDGGFHLVYQPVVSLPSGSVTGVEALLRWDSPGRGSVSPADFIPVAEQTGMIVPLGEWVLTEACEQLARWDSAMPAGPRLAMAVNVSLRQLHRPGFVDVVKTVLASTGLGTDRLVLEITETALSDDESTALLLQDLHELGIKLSIDDFGTGYSSLGRLRTSSVDYVKLDRSFVAEIDGAGAEVPIVQAMVTMAGGLGLRTIAEGIETPEQFSYLASLGYHEGQGYFMSRPVTPEAIVDLMANTPYLGRELAFATRASTDSA